MSESQKLRCYQYGNRPYEEVGDVLRRRALELLQRATTSAAARATSLAATLHVGVGAVEIGADVRPYLNRIWEDESVGGLSPVTRVEIGWKASRAPALFPSMHLELAAWPLSSGETQLEINGEYNPPLGVVGDIIDAAVGHRIAEASVLHLLDDIVAEIQHDLPATR